MSESYSTEIVPRLYHFIDRDETCLPGDYLPDAPGALIADEGMLRAAGYARGFYRPRGWNRVKPGVFEKSYGGSIHRASGYMGRERPTRRGGGLTAVEVHRTLEVRDGRNGAPPDNWPRCFGHHRHVPDALGAASAVAAAWAQSR